MTTQPTAHTALPERLVATKLPLSGQCNIKDAKSRHSVATADDPRFGAELARRYNNFYELRDTLSELLEMQGCVTCQELMTPCSRHGDINKTMAKAHAILGKSGGRMNRSCSRLGLDCGAPTEATIDIEHFKAAIAALKLAEGRE